MEIRIFTVMFFRILDQHLSFSHKNFGLTLNIGKAKVDEKPEKKTRKKRDVDAPKKPMSAFFWYQKSRRSVLKEE